MKEQIGWIDFLKGVAITTVVLDHLYYVTYTSEFLHFYTQFSVTLFIFLAGMTSVISLSRNKLSMKEYLLRRLKGILLPYAIATLLYSIVKMQYTFEFNDFWNSLLFFNASQPLYFVLFYCELTIIAPFLYKVLNDKRFIVQLILIIGMYFVSRYLTHYTYINGMVLGSSKLLGGSYLFVFFLGMFFYLNYKKYRGKLDNLILYVVGFVISSVLLYLYQKTSWLSLGWSNPPNKQTLLYSMLIFIFGLSLYIIVDRWRFSRWSVTVFEFFGLYSLYVFLYHKLVIYYIDIILNHLTFVNSNLFVKTLLYSSLAVIIPILIKLGTKHLSRYSFLKNSETK